MLAYRRLFTDGKKPVEDMFTWAKRNVKLEDKGVLLWEGEVEAPTHWSDLAVLVVAKTWFRTREGKREDSIKGMVNRVVDAIAEASQYPDTGTVYLSKKEMAAFRDELKYIILAQYGTFNTPVWVNVGVTEPKHKSLGVRPSFYHEAEVDFSAVPMVRGLKKVKAPQDPHWGVYSERAPNTGPLASACFLQSVRDDMGSIMDLQRNETQIFKRGAGSGTNFSTLRPEGWALSGGGTASGPVSFTRGYDAWGGVTKSGGASRRAAKGVWLDVYHPDVRAFVESKVEAQKMTQALVKQGYSDDYNDQATAWMPWQNGNNSVRVDDAFMIAATTGGKIPLHWPTEWNDKARTTLTSYKYEGQMQPGSGVVETIDASQLLDEIAQAAWFCGDPGLHFDTAINRWHTTPASGRISTTNPCLRKGTRLLTEEGSKAVEDLAEKTSVRIFDGFGFANGKVWKTGNKPIVRIHTNNGRALDLTEDHLVLTMDAGWIPAKDTIGQTIPNIANIFWYTKDGREASYMFCGAGENPKRFPMTVTKVENLGLCDDVYDFSCPTTNLGIANGIVVHNCSEVHYLDDTACNLATVRLTKFLDENGKFDTKRFQHVAMTLFLGQEILVGAASYPTELIAQKSHDFRPLGLNYADLGALLMQLGLAYDSDEGRAVCAGITSLLGATAYHTSARIARDCGGAYAGWRDNRSSHLAVLKMHERESINHTGRISRAGEVRMGDIIHLDAQLTWFAARKMAEQTGLRNAQMTCLAPTGTVGFQLDCDTTGIEPDTSLVKYKKLAGGGTLKLVNQSIPKVLRKLFPEASQEDIDDVLAFVEKNGVLPTNTQTRLNLDPHRAIFATAFGQPGNEISVDGHLLMMAAAQPFLSGGISKSVNVSHSYTPAQIRDIYVQAWQLGLKAVAVYRDGCKAQPVTTGKESKTLIPEDWQKAESKPSSGRRRLPADRRAHTHKFTLGGVDGYIMLGYYPEGDIGEIFVKLEPKAAAAIALDSATQMASIAIQHGADVLTLCDKWENTKFEPSGFTGEGADGTPYASSPLDYLAKWLRRHVEASTSSLPRSSISQAIPEAIVQPSAIGARLEACPQCKAALRRDGACLSCATCGYGKGGCGA